MALYQKPKTVLQQRLKETLNSESAEAVNDLIKLSLLHMAEKDESLLVYGELYNLLGLEKFTEMINLLDGRTLTLPRKDDFKDTIVTVLCYYYKSVEGASWDEIKSLLGEPDLNSIKYGIHAASLGSFLDKMVARMAVKK